MKNFWEGFCNSAGTLVGLIATMMVIGWAVESGERKSETKSEERTISKEGDLA